MSKVRVHSSGRQEANEEAGLVYDYGINTNVFSHRAAFKSAGAKDGRLRVEETRVPAERREWKIGRRDNKPEKDPFSLDKLQRRFKAQLHAGSVPRQTRQRLSIAERGQKLVKTKAKLRAKSLRVTAACKELRAEAE